MPHTLLIDHRLPQPELQAARLDGQMRPIGVAHVPIDVPPSAQLRAATLAGLLPADAVVEGRAAAWVLGAWPSPTRIVVGRRSSIRPTPELSTVIVRQLQYPADDVTVCGSIRLTTPIRTALDLARQEPRADLRLLTAVATLLEQGGIDPARALSALEGRSRLPYSLRIRRRLAELETLVSLL